MLTALVQAGEGLAAAEYFLVVLQLKVAAVRRLRSLARRTKEKGIGVMKVAGSPMFCVLVSKWPALDRRTRYARAV